MTPVKRYLHGCQTDGCPSECLTTQRDPQPWYCPTCQDLQLEEHVRFMEARSLSHSPRHVTHKEQIAS